MLPVRHLDPAVFVPPAGLARQAPEARATALPAPPEFSLPPLPPQTDWQQVLGLSDEDGLIIEARLLGKPWAEVATFTPGRTQAVLKKHYNSVLRPLVNEIYFALLSISLYHFWGDQSIGLQMEAVLQAQPHALLPHPQFQQGTPLCYLLSINKLFHYSSSKLQSINFDFMGHRWTAAA